MKTIKDYHITVMPNESVDFLNCKPGKIIVDGTIGGFGHAKNISEKIKPKGILIGIDQDLDAIKNAEKYIKRKIVKTYIEHDNFINIEKIINKIGIKSVDGILIDIGMSLNQIYSSGRGFSFSKDEPLDMRMNIKNDLTAAMILERLNEKELANLFFKYGEEKWSKRIAYQIVKARKISPIKTSLELSYLVKKTIPKKKYHENKHPATRIFMALRIAVNKELESLELFLKKSMKVLNPGGRLCIISFHSLENRIIKKYFKKFTKSCSCPSDIPICICNEKSLGIIITKKAIQPSKKEINVNPMSRSAILRVIEKK